MTRTSAIQSLNRYTSLQKRYKGYPGSPGDDARLGIYGYTVREERAYINRQVRFLKAALAEMDRRQIDELTDRECFYLIY